MIFLVLKRWLGQHNKRCSHGRNCQHYCRKTLRGLRTEVLIGEMEGLGLTEVVGVGAIESLGFVVG